MGPGNPGEMIKANIIDHPGADHPSDARNLAKLNEIEVTNILISFTINLTF